MAHRPNQSLIIVVNADGSGYVLQFDTLSDAKDAFRGITTDGVAYLYPPATKSLSSKPAGSPAPISSTGSDVPTQGGVAGDVKKGMSFTAVQNVGADTPVSTEVVCLVGNSYDMDGTLFTGPFYRHNKVTYASGRIEHIQTGQGASPCFYPNNYRINFEERINLAKIEERTIYSLDYGGNVYGPYYNPQYLLKRVAIYTIADGNGGTREEYETGVLQLEDATNNSPVKRTWINYSVGDAPYKFDEYLNVTNQIGQPIPNGRYLVTYRVDGDERIHSGYWIGRIDNVEAATVVWKFEPIDPTQPPPPPCSVTKKSINPQTGSVIDICDPDIVYPYSVSDDCEPPATVTINGTEIVVGRNTKNGMNNGYGDIVWGDCSGMIYHPNGIKIFEDSDYNYYSDGQGSYYSELKVVNPPCEDPELHTGEAGWSYDGCNWSYTNPCEDANLHAGEAGWSYDGCNWSYSEPCPSYGTQLSSDGGNYTVNVGCGDFIVGSWGSATYADGNCGNYGQGGGSYYSNGTPIGNCNDYNYYSDGNGGSYQGEYTGTQCEDSMLHANEAGWSYDGCYWSYSEPCPSYGTEISSDSGYYTVNFGCGDINVGQWGSTTYADGNCGTYNSGGASYYYYNGQLIQNCNDYNYYSDGNSGSYQGEYTGGSGCPSYGTELIPAQSGTYYTSTPCGDIATGSWYDDTDYADGNCGYYSDNTSYYNYLAYGSFIINCENYNLYADGYNGYYTGEYTGA